MLFGNRSLLLLSAMALRISGAGPTLACENIARLSDASLWSGGDTMTAAERRRSIPLARRCLRAYLKRHGPAQEITCGVDFRNNSYAIFTGVGGSLCLNWMVDNADHRRCLDFRHKDCRPAKKGKCKIVFCID